jgi:hypothetical protein
MRIPDPQDCVKVVGVLTLSCSPSGSRASGAAPCGPSPALTCPPGLETVQNVRTKNTIAEPTGIFYSSTKTEKPRDYPPPPIRKKYIYKENFLIFLGHFQNYSNFFPFTSGNFSYKVN